MNKGGGGERIISGGGVQNRFWGGALWYVFPSPEFPPPLFFCEKSTQTFSANSCSRTLRVMDVRAANRGRPHPQVVFSAVPVMGRNLLTQLEGHASVRVRNVHAQSGPTSSCLCCFFFPRDLRPIAPSLGLGSLQPPCRARNPKPKSPNSSASSPDKGKISKHVQNYNVRSEPFHDVQTRSIVKGEAQKSPLFWRFSGFWIFSGSPVLQEFHKKTLKFKKSPIFTTPLVNPPVFTMHLVCTLLSLSLQNIP